MRPSPVRALTASLALAALTTACGHAQPPPPQPEAAAVPVAPVQQGTVSPRTMLSGIIAPLQNVGITSSLAEPTDAVYVKEGDHVRRGQRLALLDTADLRAQLAEYQATVSSNAAKATQSYDQAGLTIVQNSNTVDQARAAVRQAQQTLANDTLNLRRNAQLLAQGYIPQQQYDTLATTVRIDRQAVDAAGVTLQNDIRQVAANGTTSSGLQGSIVAAAQATTQISQAQADQIRVQIAKASIVSPIDGVVVNRNLNPGEFPGTRQIFSLQATSRVYAVLSGSAAQVVGLRPGAAVSVSSSSLPGKQFTGTGSTNFVVKALLQNPTGTLLPGMAVSGAVRLPSTRGLMIPDTAFLDTTNSTVQIVDGTTVQTAKVTMLADDGKNAVVMGLSPGATVVINGQSGLTDGQTVAPQQVAKASP
jgi:HlyD family secretion protein